MVSIIKVIKNHYRQYLWLGLSLYLVLKAWVGPGLGKLELDTDLGRDLKEISNISLHKIVWLGPWMGPGLHASSTYYYLFYPALVLAKWQPIGMVVMNMLLSLGAISLAAVALGKKNWYLTGLIILVLGLSPWINQTAIHPGNGFTYALFSLAAIVSIFQAYPIWLLAIFTGWATALHPAAALLILPFGHQLWLRRQKIKTICLSLLLFLAPWSTLLGYELITKGFITRRFLQHPSTGVIIPGFSFDNLQALASLLGLPLIVFLIMGILGAFQAYKHQNRFKFGWVWFGFLGISLLFFKGVPPRYLYTLAALGSYLLIAVLGRAPAGQKLLIIYAISLLLQSSIFAPKVLVTRSIDKIVGVATALDKAQIIDKTQTIAVVAALWKEALVPQADDYRYLLRTKGYTVTEITEQEKAQVLVMFIENNDFDWQHWHNFEVDSFGAKNLITTFEVNGVLVAIYRRV